jgi:hypothetical protein
MDTGVPSKRVANDESSGCTYRDTVFQPDSRESVCVVCATPERGSASSIGTSRISEGLQQDSALERA